MCTARSHHDLASSWIIQLTVSWIILQEITEISSPYKNSLQDRLLNGSAEPYPDRIEHLFSLHECIGCMNLPGDEGRCYRYFSPVPVNRHIMFLSNIPMDPRITIYMIMVRTNTGN